MSESVSNPAPQWSGSAGTPPKLPKPVHIQLPELEEDPDTASVVQLALAAAVETFIEHDARSGAGDVRGVHQARVGLRRFRSHLRTFRRVLDPEWASALSAEAAWHADFLGAVRDLDVLRIRLVDGALLQTPDQAPAIAGVVKVLDRERLEAVNVLEEVRRSARFEGLVARLIEASQTVPTRESGEELADVLIPRMLQRTWRELRVASHKERKDPTIENLHTVRIRAKRMRYACEAATPVLGPDAKRTAKAAEAVQERLGEWHDASAAKAWLETTGKKHPDLAVIALRIGELEVVAAEQAASSWKSEFREIKAGWKKIEPKRKKR
ncbi:MAG: CHAD domain-containing protein [Acidimicrobiales bacterium]